MGRSFAGEKDLARAHKNEDPETEAVYLAASMKSVFDVAEGLRITEEYRRF